MKKLHIDERYISVNLTRTIIIYAFLVPYCIYLSADNFRHGSEMIALLAAFCATMTAIALGLLCICRFGKNPPMTLMHISIIIQCFVYWFTFGVFLYTGGTGGTSIFLIFAAAPVCFFFFNLFYGSIFCVILFIGMTIYMRTPLHLMGYQFPPMYYIRLPMMYLIEVIMCAIAQYEADKAKIKQDIALDEARRANAAKSDFLANTSHEIRTPINAVLGMNEMILRESERTGKNSDDITAYRKSIARIKSYAANVDSAGNNLLSIINDILDFTKIEEGRMDIVDVEYQLSSVLNDVSNMIYFKAQEKNLDFETDIDRNLPDRLCGDEVRVRQIITNILSNAVKYTDEGRITLAISCTDIVTDGAGNKMTRLSISVSDTGRGIKQDDIGRLFNKFERVDLDKNSTIEGTGLGLAITSRLLSMMGGDISVESIYGVGSTFKIILPQKVMSEEPLGDFEIRFENQMGEKKKHGDIFRAPSARILIVDDTRMNLVVATEFLRDSLIKIDTALSGKDAIEMAQSNKYDVILMDQRMPGMDGVEAMHHIKEQKDGINAGTPMICLTADAVIGAKERYLSQGFTDYLSKPLDSLLLEGMLRKYLPPDKVQIISYEDAVINGDKDRHFNRDRFEKLYEVGIDVNKGIRSCGNDEKFYISMLTEYYEISSEKKSLLREYLDNDDMNSYAILVHAIKSTSATIGAMNVSDLAEKLEHAADEGNIDVVRNEHDKMTGAYDLVVNAIGSIISAKEKADHNSGKKDEVLEFAPL